MILPIPVIIVIGIHTIIRLIERIIEDKREGRDLLPLCGGPVLSLFLCCLSTIYLAYQFINQFIDGKTLLLLQGRESIFGLIILNGLYIGENSNSANYKGVKNSIYHLKAILRLLGVLILNWCWIILLDG